MDTPFSYKLEKTCTVDYWRIWTMWAQVLIVETKRTGSESGSEYIAFLRQLHTTLNVSIFLLEFPFYNTPKFSKKYRQHFPMQ